MTRVAVVTGAAGTIGSATCDVLEDAGWRVVAVDKLAIDRDGSIQLDLADPDGIAQQLGQLPQVDGLVNNAAQQLYKPLLETSIAEWDSVAAVNLRGAFACIKAVAPQLIAARGAVVNIGSVHARATSLSIAAYAASKGGLEAFTRAAALELAAYGVRVNAVLPGAVDTPALQAGFARIPDLEDTLLGRTPLGRVGHPQEIAMAVRFLLDDSWASFITGQSLVADGGALARLGTE